MADESPADQVFSTKALSEHVLSFLSCFEPAERRAVGKAACACRGLRDAARAAMAELQRRELPHAAVPGDGASASSLWRSFEAAAAAWPFEPWEDRAWPLDSLTFVLHLQRADGRLFFEAAAQPEWTVLRGYRPEVVVKPVEFVGAFVPGAAPRFEQSDTASLFVKHAAVRGGRAARVACLSLKLQQQRIPRENWYWSDEDDDSDVYTLQQQLLLRSWNEDEEYRDQADSYAFRWQPAVKDFEPRSLFFVTPHKELPRTYNAISTPRDCPRCHNFGSFDRVDTCYALACSIGGAEDATDAQVHAALSFLCDVPLALDDYEGNAPLNLLQLTELLTRLEWR